MPAYHDALRAAARPRVIASVGAGGLALSLSSLLMAEGELLRTYFWLVLVLVPLAGLPLQAWLTARDLDLGEGLVAALPVRPLEFAAAKVAGGLVLNLAYLAAVLPGVFLVASHSNGVPWLYTLIVAAWVLFLGAWTALAGTLLGALGGRSRARALGAGFLVGLCVVLFPLVAGVFNGMLGSVGSVVLNGLAYGSPLMWPEASLGLSFLSSQPVAPYPVPLGALGSLAVVAGLLVVSFIAENPLTVSRSGGSSAAVALAALVAFAGVHGLLAGDDAWSGTWVIDSTEGAGSYTFEADRSLYEAPGDDRVDALYERKIGVGTPLRGTIAVTVEGPAHGSLEIRNPQVTGETTKFRLEDVDQSQTLDLDASGTATAWFSVLGQAGQLDTFGEDSDHLVLSFTAAGEPVRLLAGSPTVQGGGPPSPGGWIAASAVPLLLIAAAVPLHWRTRVYAST